MYQEELGETEARDSTVNKTKFHSQKFKEYLLELGLDTHRYINVENGRKYPTTKIRQCQDDIFGNYGIMAGNGLVIIRIENHDAAEATGVLDILPETFTVESPHATESRFYNIEGDVGNAIEKATVNPDFAILSWGQVWVDKLYAMGPGSQLNAESCNEDDCKTCGLTGAGYYEVSHAPEPAITTISIEALIQAVLAEFDSDDVDPIKFLL